jgi:hypothetical protein
MKISTKKDAPMMVDCRLIVLQEENMSSELVITFNNIVSTFCQQGGFTFVSGQREATTLTLTRAWPKSIFNADEYLDFQSFTIDYLDQFQEVIFLKAKRCTVFRQEMKPVNRHKLA